MSYHQIRDIISTMTTPKWSTSVKQRVEIRNSLSVLTQDMATNLEGHAPIRVQSAQRRSVDHVSTAHMNDSSSKDGEPALEDQCSAKKAAHLGERKEDTAACGYCPPETVLTPYTIETI